MHLAVLVIWWIGLIGAIPATLTILKLASLIVYTLIDIARLGVYTRRAAEGIAVNVSTISRWPDLGEPVRQIAAGTQRIATLARSMHATLSSM